MTWCKLLCFSSLNWDRMSSGESGSFTRLVGRKREGLWMCCSGHRAGFARIPTPSAGWPPAHHHPSLRSPRVHWATRAVQANPELEAGTMWPIFSDPIQPPDPFLTWRRKLILSKNQGGAPFQAPNLKFSELSSEFSRHEVLQTEELPPGLKHMDKSDDEPWSQLIIMQQYELLMRTPQK